MHRTNVCYILIIFGITYFVKCFILNFEFIFHSHIPYRISKHKKTVENIYSLQLFTISSYIHNNAVIFLNQIPTDHIIICKQLVSSIILNAYVFPQMLGTFFQLVNQIHPHTQIKRQIGILMCGVHGFPHI